MATSGAGEFLTQAVRFLMQNKRYWLVPLILTVVVVGLLAVLSSSSTPPLHYTLY